MALKGMSLHIGLNAVSPKHYEGWSGELHACEYDAEVYEGIARQAGFKSTPLLTANATSVNVLKAIGDAAKKLAREISFSSLIPGMAAR